MPYCNLFNHLFILLGFCASLACTSALAINCMASSLSARPMDQRQRQMALRFYSMWYFIRSEVSASARGIKSTQNCGFNLCFLVRQRAMCKYIIRNMKTFSFKSPQCNITVADIHFTELSLLNIGVHVTFEVKKLRTFLFCLVEPYNGQSIQERPSKICGRQTMSLQIF